jgi:hypothetical protein
MSLIESYFEEIRMTNVFWKAIVAFYLRSKTTYSSVSMYNKLQRAT